MKVVILAGGFGTRLSEETRNLPKPMVETDDIYMHVMKIYSHKLDENVSLNTLEQYYG